MEDVSLYLGKRHLTDNNQKMTLSLKQDSSRTKTSMKIDIPNNLTNKTYDMLVGSKSENPQGNIAIINPLKDRVEVNETGDNKNRNVASWYFLLKLIKPMLHFIFN